MTARDTGAAAAPGDRLRPGTAVTPLRAGLHLRGRRGSVTLEGSTAVPVVWGLLEEPLRSGGLGPFREGLEPGSALHVAVDTLLARLAEHDLLVPGPPPAAEPAGVDPADAAAADADAEPAVARWLGATARHPADAAAALAAARAEVLARDPGSPLASAAVRALAAGGLPVTRTADAALPADRVLLTVRGPGPGAARAVVAGCVGGTGYATAPGSAAQALADAVALEARLDGATPPAGAEGGKAPGPGGVPASFPVLLAGAAAHRLLCAAAGLPDPAAEGEDPRLLPGIPAVLLAEARPARADHHSWLGPVRIDADRLTDLAPPAVLDEAMRRIAALGERRCGPLPGPEPEDLPQLPVPLAACTLPGPPRGAPGTSRTLTGGGPRLDLARLELFCRAAELLLGEDAFTVGADPGHALGRFLRHLASRRYAGPPDHRTAVAPAMWSAHPQYRHWWTTLTDRLGTAARTEVHRLAPHAEAYRAVVRRAPRDAAHGAGTVLGEGIEATPGDAAAFAALAAVTAVVTAGSGSPAGPGAGTSGRADTAGGPRPSGGAVAPLASAAARTAAWEDHRWTGGWLADLAGREAGFRSTLRRLTCGGPGVPAGWAGAPDRPPAHAPDHAPDPEPAGVLRAFGFTVLRTAEEAR
ncbi:hypothetical protein AB0O18_11460 [Streptomyces sp. NPDC093224]|uniref:hypothetical protein n=1 Tax=Streptomyces sp. NPDC093224 TaxID=3155198 RepID=UPI00344AFA9F